jgi:hypothetical protein
MTPGLAAPGKTRAHSSTTKASAANLIPDGTFDRRWQLSEHSFTVIARSKPKMRSVRADSSARTRGNAVAHATVRARYDGQTDWRTSPHLLQGEEHR